MKSEKILIVEMGIPGDSQRERFGTYGDWFVRAMEAVDPGRPTGVVPVAESRLECLAEAAGVILSGAEEGVYDELPWRGNFDKILRELIGTGKPILGVCFGHQYLADVLGGTVEPSVSGAEMGFHPLELTEEGLCDPLFAGIEREFTAIETHNDAVVEPPPDAVLLASSPRLRYQAFRWGENVRGVQFHPEMTGEIVNYVIDERGTPEEFSSGKIIRKPETHPHAGAQLLSNFLDICN